MVDRGTAVRMVDALIEADRTAPKRILVVGDGMTDVYVHGKMHTGCQDGCPKFVEELRVAVLGGAANAARSLEKWNATISLFGYAGGTENPTKTRYMVEDRCEFRHDHDRIRFDTSVIRIACLRTLRERKFDAVLLSDYDKGVLTPKFIRDVVELCNNRGVPCVADCKRGPEVYDSAILKGNLDWYLKHGGADVVTRGDLPPLVEGVYPSPDVYRNMLTVRCVNHVGAGDCFVAHLTLALAHKFPLADAVAFAHHAGRVYVQFAHNRPPHPAEIRADATGMPIDATTLA